MFIACLSIVDVKVLSIPRNNFNRSTLIWAGKASVGLAHLSYSTTESLHVFDNIFEIFNWKFKIIFSILGIDFVKIKYYGLYSPNCISFETDLYKLNALKRKWMYRNQAMPCLRWLNDYALIRDDKNRAATKSFLNYIARENPCLVQWKNPRSNHYLYKWLYTILMKLLHLIYQLNNVIMEGDVILNVRLYWSLDF